LSGFFIAAKEVASMSPIVHIPGADRDGRSWVFEFPYETDDPAELLVLRQAGAVDVAVPGPEPAGFAPLPPIEESAGEQVSEPLESTPARKPRREV
jgi:hypothetical protein